MRLANDPFAATEFGACYLCLRLTGVRLSIIRLAGFWFGLHRARPDQKAFRDQLAYFAPFQDRQCTRAIGIFDWLGGEVGQEGEQGHSVEC